MRRRLFNHSPAGAGGGADPDQFGEEPTDHESPMAELLVSP